LVGVVRSLMAQVGLRGPVASAMFTVLRLTKDQILENATGGGAPRQTWPSQRLAVDLLHKAIYGFATGAVADALAGRNGLGPGQRHAAMRPGRQADVGPLPGGRPSVLERPELMYATRFPSGRRVGPNAATGGRSSSEVCRLRPLRARVDPRPRLLVAPAAGGGVAAPTHHGHAVGVAARRRLHVEPVDVREAPQPGPLHRETAQRLVGPG
jgi:hypothetical protein